MSISLNEFHRLLPAAFRNINYKVKNNQINASYAGGELQILLGDEYERKMASLSLPVLNITIVFDNIAQNDMEHFLEIFNRAYQRGGG